MTWVKICGITNLEDALTAVDAGADALGFVFYEKSPRYIDPRVAGEIAKKLPQTVEKIGVFAGGYDDGLPELVRQVGLTGTQTHIRLDLKQSCSGIAFGAGCFPERFEFCFSLPAEWFTEDPEGVKRMVTQWSEVTERRRASSEGRPSDVLRTVFLDSGSLQQPGGTGRTFDWVKAAPIVEYMRSKVRVVVAGGLTPANVSEAMHILKPWGVDVSSGVEAAPGKKDREKVRAFVAAVREVDRKAQ